RHPRDPAQPDGVRRRTGRGPGQRRRSCGPEPASAALNPTAPGSISPAADKGPPPGGGPFSRPRTAGASGQSAPPGSRRLQTADASRQPTPPDSRCDRQGRLRPVRRLLRPVVVLAESAAARVGLIAQSGAIASLGRLETGPALRGSRLGLDRSLGLGGSLSYAGTLSRV